MRNIGSANAPLFASFMSINQIQTNLSFEKDADRPEATKLSSIKRGKGGLFGEILHVGRHRLLTFSDMGISTSGQTAIHFCHAGCTAAAPPLTQPEGTPRRDEETATLPYPTSLPSITCLSCQLYSVPPRATTIAYPPCLPALLSGC